MRAFRPVNVRSTFRFNALTPLMRANIVGPPNVATTIRASIAASGAGEPAQERHFELFLELLN